MYIKHMKVPNFFYSDTDVYKVVEAALTSTHLKFKTKIYYTVSAGSPTLEHVEQDFLAA